MNIRFFARGPHCWGVGPTEAEALKQARKNHFKENKVPDRSFTLIALVNSEDTSEYEIEIDQIDGMIRGVPNTVTIIKYQTASR